MNQRAYPFGECPNVHHGDLSDFYYNGYVVSHRLFHCGKTGAAGSRYNQDPEEGQRDVHPVS